MQFEIIGLFFIRLTIQKWVNKNVHTITNSSGKPLEEATSFNDTILWLSESELQFVSVGSCNFISSKCLLIFLTREFIRSQGFWRLCSDSLLSFFSKSYLSWLLGGMSTKWKWIQSKELISQIMGIFLTGILFCFFLIMMVFENDAYYWW